MDPNDIFIELRELQRLCFNYLSPVSLMLEGQLASRELIWRGPQPIF